jgi:hypothetical protein
LLAEGAVIVVSILLALLAEAWWSDRSDRAAELDLLTALHAELLSNRSAVEQQLRDIDTARFRLESLLRMTPADIAAIPSDSLVPHVRTPLFRSYTTELAVGELNAAVSSGSLSLIRNRELRSSLAAYQATQGDASELGQLLNELNREARLALARVPGLAAWAAAENSPYAETSAYTEHRAPTSAPHGALETIVRDPDLIAIISAKAGFFNPFFYELGRVLRDLDRVIALIEYELGL